MNPLVVPEAHRNCSLDPHMRDQHSDLIPGDVACPRNLVIPEFPTLLQHFAGRGLAARDYREYAGVSMLGPPSHLIIQYWGSCIPDFDLSQSHRSDELMMVVPNSCSLLEKLKSP